MSAAELTQSILSGLSATAQVAHFSVLLGAGASAAAGLPDWNTLAKRLLVDSGTITDERTAVAFLAEQDPSLAAEAARAGGSDWSELVRRALYGASASAPEPAVLHLATAALAVGRAVGDVGLFTLNFDLLLEDALRLAVEEVGGTEEVVPRPLSAPRASRGSYEVHHLHGLLAPVQGDAEGPVLTLSDHAELGRQSHPWQVAALQEALQKGPMILAGTSYRDPDIRQWIYGLTRSPGMAPFDLTVLLAREGLGLSRREFERVKDTLAAQWSAIGVRAILVHDHSDAAQALRELPELSAIGYRAPDVRANGLLNCHLEDFDALQQVHAEQLEADLDALRPHLGDQANLTLWLDDGAGQLVRWASQDRVYRRPDHLRRVPVGFDSPWIAGQRLGRDDLLARDLERSEDTRRWRSVVAAPIQVELPGGPVFSTAVLSSAIAEPLVERDVDAWRQELTSLALAWAGRLEALAS